jgi:hypothetical protein
MHIRRSSFIHPVFEILPHASPRADHTVCLLLPLLCCCCSVTMTLAAARSLAWCGAWRCTSSLCRQSTSSALTVSGGSNVTVVKLLVKLTFH